MSNPNPATALAAERHVVLGCRETIGNSPISSKLDESAGGPSRRPDSRAHEKHRAVTQVADHRGWNGMGEGSPPWSR